MKTCKKCGTEITNGVNGYMMSDFCFDCGGYPVYAKPTKHQDDSDYEGAILAAAENYNE